MELNTKFEKLEYNKSKEQVGMKLTIYWWIFFINLDKT